VHTGHPTPFTYFKVAMTLAAITAAEVGVFYIEDLGHGIIPILVVLSGVKFALVAMFYMHLQFDSRLFSVLFFGGLALAASIAVALMGLFGAFQA
jgi:cytochrome c oxidase subunit 4